jgi:hypothetical protein
VERTSTEHERLVDERLRGLMHDLWMTFTWTTNGPKERNCRFDYFKASELKTPFTRGLWNNSRKAVDKEKPSQAIEDIESDDNETGSNRPKVNNC